MPVPLLFQVSLAFDHLHVAVPPDGRQSPHALAVQRGVGRLLRSYGFAVVTELALGGGRRADVVGLGADGEIWIVEIKSSIEDFRVDQKWPDYRLSCDRLFFASHAGVPSAIFPEDAGLILADSFGGEILGNGAGAPPAGATRKAMLVRFAQAAALRLHGLIDPAARRACYALAKGVEGGIFVGLEPSGRNKLVSLESGSAVSSGLFQAYRGARLARMRCSVRRCMLSRRAVSETLRSQSS